MLVFKSKRGKFCKGYEILVKYKDEANDIHLKHLDKEDFIKLKGLSMKLGLPGNIK